MHVIVIFTTCIVARCSPKASFACIIPQCCHCVYTLVHLPSLHILLCPMHFDPVPSATTFISVSAG